MNADSTLSAKILWDYMVLNEPAGPADLLLVLGSIDERVALRAAELTKLYSYDIVCFTGGLAHEHDLLKTTWTQTEAEHFRDIFCESEGVAQKILLETKAQNTGQNARFTHDLLVREELSLLQSMQIVTKPYMERRAKATFEAQWPSRGTVLRVTSPQLSFVDYCVSENTVAIMVGDFERIMNYPDHGFQTKQEIPEIVRLAWANLVDQGYIGHLIN